MRWCWLHLRRSWRLLVGPLHKNKAEGCQCYGVCVQNRTTCMFRFHCVLHVLNFSFRPHIAAWYVIRRVDIRVCGNAVCAGGFFGIGFKRAFNMKECGYAVRRSHV